MIGDIIIREAMPQQAEALSAIALKAKAYWGYSAAQIDSWRSFLTVSPDYIRANRVWTALFDSTPITGFAAIEQHGDEAVLEHLWVLPDCIGRGVGGRLFRHAASVVPEFSFTSDPHADAFYRRMGAQKIGEQYSVLQGVMLTVFRYTSK